MKKICTKCNISKELQYFHKSKRHKFGIKNECAKCTNLYLKNHYAKNKQSYNNRSRQNHLKNKYNISYEEYLKLYSNRKGKCDICVKTCEPAGPNLSNRKNALVVDHCHKTNKVRGLLCQTCNQGIGLFKDSIDNLISAHVYLLQDSDIKGEL